MSDGIRGVVGVIANPSARFTMFQIAMDQLILPEGFMKDWRMGGDWCGARNDLVRFVLDTGADYLWFMDDDHWFQPDVLLRLETHQKDIVMPVCLMRHPPFVPVEFTGHIDAETLERIYLPDYPGEGLVELEAGGTAGMLIHRRVLEAIEPPWFEYSYRSEDLIFCQKAKEAGFSLWLDLGLRISHLTHCAVTPIFHGGRWVVNFNFGANYHMTAEFAPREPQEEPA